MKIKFDSNQDYQLEAIRSVVDIFDGQPFARGAFEVDLGMESGKLLSELGFGNQLLIDDQTILENVRAVQERNGLPVTEILEGMHFTTEMETGTGKTYVYLRTIYELNKLYGLRKFIIVVPSVAIREGVLKSIELTRVHFRAIYGNEPVDFFVYDSARLSNLRGFAGSNQLQIMVMNIDAFNKDTNVIRRNEDRMSGRKPLEFIQATNPVVIIDEPQNMELEQARRAIASLNPLCTLRYSATHRNLYNLVYRLDPVRVHSKQLAEHGGAPGIRDEGAIESALARPRQLFHYGEDVDLPRLAAAYGFGLAKNHGYVDGKKRIAFVAVNVFLDLNGYKLDVSEPEAVATILALAGGELSEEDLADWIRNKTSSR